MLVEERTGRWFTGLRPVLEALQQEQALRCNMEIPLEKKRLPEGACCRQAIVGGCYRGCMRSCLVFRVSCKPAVCSEFFFSHTVY